MRSISLLAHDANSVSPWVLRLQYRLRVRAHDDGIVSHKGQVLRERGLLIHVNTAVCCQRVVHVSFLMYRTLGHG